MTTTVLVADDEPNIVVSLEYLLERNGYTVRVARDGEEALAHVAQFRPALVLRVLAEALGPEGRQQRSSVRPWSSSTSCCR